MSSLADSHAPPSNLLPPPWGPPRPHGPPATPVSWSSAPWAASTWLTGDPAAQASPAFHSPPPALTPCLLSPPTTVATQPRTGRNSQKPCLSGGKACLQVPGSGAPPPRVRRAWGSASVAGELGAEPQSVTCTRCGPCFRGPQCAQDPGRPSFHFPSSPHLPPSLPLPFLSPLPPSLSPLNMRY